MHAMKMALFILYVKDVVILDNTGNNNNIIGHIGNNNNYKNNECLRFNVRLITLTTFL